MDRFFIVFFMMAALEVLFNFRREEIVRVKYVKFLE